MAIMKPTIPSTMPNREKNESPVMIPNPVLTKLAKMNGNETTVNNQKLMAMTLDQGYPHCQAPLANQRHHRATHAHVPQFLIASRDAARAGGSGQFAQQGGGEEPEGEPSG